MTAAHSILVELEDAIANGTSQKRVDTLRRVTDLFMIGADQYSEEQVGLFDSVIARLADDIEARARAELAQRLAKVAQAPPMVMTTLADDDIIEVAAPVLTHSPRLDDADAGRHRPEKGPGSPAGDLATPLDQRTRDRRPGRARQSAGRAHGRAERRRPLLRRGFRHPGQALGRRRRARLAPRACARTCRSIISPSWSRPRPMRCAASSRPRTRWPRSKSAACSPSSPPRSRRKSAPCTRDYTAAKAKIAELRTCGKVRRSGSARVRATRQVRGNGRCAVGSVRTADRSGRERVPGRQFGHGAGGCARGRIRLADRQADPAAAVGRRKPVGTGHGERQGQFREAAAGDRAAGRALLSGAQERRRSNAQARARRYRLAHGLLGNLGNRDEVRLAVRAQSSEPPRRRARSLPPPAPTGRPARA